MTVVGSIKSNFKSLFEKLGLAVGQEIISHKAKIKNKHNKVVLAVRFILFTMRLMGRFAHGIKVTIFFF